MKIIPQRDFYPDWKLRWTLTIFASLRCKSILNNYSTNVRWIPNRIIVLLNLMSFLKPSKLENYTQIFIQVHFSFTKWRFHNKEKIKWNARLLQRQSNENLNAKQAALSNEVNNHFSFKKNLSNEENAPTQCTKILKSVKSSS